MRGFSGCDLCFQFLADFRVPSSYCCCYIPSSVCTLRAYCDVHLCLSVCLSAPCKHQKYMAIFTKFSCITYSHTSVFLWQQYATLCTSCSLDDIMFAHNGQKWGMKKSVYSKWLNRGQHWSLIYAAALFREIQSCCWILTEPASSVGDVTAGESDAVPPPTYEDVAFIERVMEVTRCHDRRLVTELCAEAGYFDLDAVCSHVLAFMDGVRSSSSSSTTSDGEATASGSVATASIATAAAASKTKSRATRRQRKLEKKARAVQRHRANAAVPASNSVVASATTAAAAGGGFRGSCSDEDDVSPFVISQQLKVLQI